MKMEGKKLSRASPRVAFIYLNFHFDVKHRSDPSCLQLDLGKAIYPSKSIENGSRSIAKRLAVRVHKSISLFACLIKHFHQQQFQVEKTFEHPPSAFVCTQDVGCRIWMEIPQMERKERKTYFNLAGAPCLRFRIKTSWTNFYRSEFVASMYKPTWAGFSHVYLINHFTFH